MRKFSFSKLVRDNIVNLIVANGNIPHWKVLDEQEYITELQNKLVEESLELSGARGEEIVGELADIQEIVDNLRDALHISSSELARAQEAKRDKNGSFKNRHYIDYVEVQDKATEIDYYSAHPDKYPEISHT